MRCFRPFGVALTLLGVSCGMPVARLPDLPRDAVAAEQRRQQIGQLRHHYSAQQRVDTVAFRLRTANASFCQDRIAAQIGLTAATPRSLPRKFQSYSGEALSIGWTRPTAISVVEGSPAAKAGLQTGDEIITLNDELIPLWGTANWMWRKIAENGTVPVRLTRRRDGADSIVVVTPVMGCSIRVDYRIDETANASASDFRLTINSGFLALTRTDAEIAIALGHELAHSTLGHLDKQRWNQLLGTTTGAAIDIAIQAGGVSTGGAFRKQFTVTGALAFSATFEREADYVGTYYAARAGYDTQGAEDIWRRFSLIQPQIIANAGTHPISPVRFVQIQRTTAEIADKKRRGLPLIPELRVATATPGTDVDVLD